MSVLTFKGGIHPPEKKELSKDKKITKVPIPDLVTVFLNQNTGKPPLLKVAKDSAIKTGQKIAEAQGSLSVPLHSPITGKILDIKKIMHPISQKLEDAVIIQKTGEDVFEYLPQLKSSKDQSKEILYQRVLDAGIVGLGGAAFPSHFKHIEAMKKPVDYVLLNAAECEPYLTIDDRLMIEQPQGIVSGLEILMKITGAKKGYIGIEENKPEAFQALSKFASPTIELCVLKTKYPQGGEKQLIDAITHREVPIGGFPIHVGVIVHNVATAFAIFEAVELGKPLYERGVTVTGEGVVNASNFWVRIGTPITQLIELAGGFRNEKGNATEFRGKVIVGGPMMGFPIKDLTIPVMKGTCGIVVLPERMVNEIREMTCINCGFCLHACSLHLEPNYLAKLVKAKKFQESYDNGVNNCCECGSCSYVCPSKIEHVKHFKLAKKLYTTLKGGKV